MKVQLDFIITPFCVPSEITATPSRRVTVRRPNAGEGDHLKMPLSELDYTTLDKLCKEFRDGVFRSANVRDVAPAPLLEVQPQVDTGPVFHGGGRD